MASRKRAEQSSATPTSTTLWTGIVEKSHYPVDRIKLIKMFHYVYTLESIKNKGLYIGYTNDLKTRLNQHNSGQNISTKPYMPWKLIFYESYLSGKDAHRRERYLKTSQGSRLLKRMLKEYLYAQK